MSTGLCTRRSVESAWSHRTRLEVTRAYAISKIGWIRTQRAKLHGQARETPRRLIERESHDLWGRRYLLSVVEQEEKPSVRLTHRKLTLRVRPRSSRARREAVMHDWHKALLHDLVPRLRALVEGFLRLDDHAKSKTSAAPLLAQHNDDVIFFADDGGSWQVGTDFRAALPAYFQCLADTASSEDFARVVDKTIKELDEYDRPRHLVAARRVASADQKRALRSLSSGR